MKLLSYFSIFFINLLFISALYAEIGIEVQGGMTHHDSITSFESNTINISAAGYFGLTDLLSIGIQSGISYTDLDNSNSGFTIPGLVNFRLCWYQEEEYSISPYITTGAGFFMTRYIDSEDLDKNCTGLGWQFMIGAIVKFDKNDPLQLVVDFGYRWAKVKYEDSVTTLRLDFKGLMYNFGIRYPI